MSIIRFRIYKKQWLPYEHQAWENLKLRSKLGLSDIPNNWKQQP